MEKNKIKEKNPKKKNLLAVGQEKTRLLLPFLHKVASYLITFRVSLSCFILACLIADDHISSSSHIVKQARFFRQW